MTKRSVDGNLMLEGLENPTFTTKMRGYDPDEVQEFLADVAETLRDQKNQADRAYQAVGEEMGDMLQEARDRADAMIADAEQRAAEIVAEATATAEETRSRAQAEATATRGDADDHAARTRAEAEQAAARLAADAARGAEELRAQAQQDADERTARADERVRVLLSEENEARKRIRGLTDELLTVSQTLRNLEGSHDGAGDAPKGVVGAPVAGGVQFDAASVESRNPVS